MLPCMSWMVLVHREALYADVASNTHIEDMMPGIIVACGKPCGQTVFGQALHLQLRGRQCIHWRHSFTMKP